MVLSCLLYDHANECAFSFDYMEIICKQSVFQSKREKLDTSCPDLFLLISRCVCVCGVCERERDKELTDGSLNMDECSRKRTQDPIKSQTEVSWGR